MIFSPVRLFVSSLLALPVLLHSLSASAQLVPQDYIPNHYTKTMVQIPMRDGVKLQTTLYIPRDTSRTYPFMINRTPYSTQPYEANQYDRSIAPSKKMLEEKYIFVHQDVRGRWMSEGQFDNMRPHVPGDAEIDESSDTYDTIEWLLKNVPVNNGKVGIWGISYPGFYTAAALAEQHPAIAAASPQAPISDFFFDDFHHHGAYLQSYFLANSTFGHQHNGPTSQQWYQSYNPQTPDAWQFHMNLGPLGDAGARIFPDNFLWNQIVEHPNYDEFWQKRNILPHLNDVKAAVLTVGGLFDAEDLYGPFNVYKTLEKNNPNIFNMIVMGPWSHGDWAHVRGPHQVVGKVSFGANVSQYYQENIEAPFFRHFLKGEGQPPEYEAIMFDTGTRKWRGYDSWPPKTAQTVKLYLRGDQKLSAEPPVAGEKTFTEYFSDPMDPVPYRDRKDIRFRFTPREYMSDDQRFAASRPDVLVFQTEPLTKPLTITGDILAHLAVSTSESDADWVVKVIDVLPDDHPFISGSDPDLKFGGSQLMIRSEVIRGRFRNSYEHPEPFTPNEVATVQLPLQDICHTFKPGHRLMIQIQSTWFPLIDRNPQKYVDNIFKAKPEDFTKATHRVFHSPDAATWIEVKVAEEENR